jgi:hypothetical protein
LHQKKNPFTSRPVGQRGFCTGKKAGARAALNIYDDRRATKAWLDEVGPAKKNSLQQFSKAIRYMMPKVLNIMGMSPIIYHLGADAKRRASSNCTDKKVN